MFVPVDASATWSPLSEAGVKAFADALDNSPLQRALFDWCASLGDGGFNRFHRSGFNRARHVRLLWQGDPGGQGPYPLEAIAEVDLPDAYGAVVSHLQVTLEVVVSIGYTATGQPGGMRLPVDRMYGLIDALTATLADEPVTTVLAALAGIDPLVVPQPIGLDFKSSTDVPKLLAGNGLTTIPDAGTSRGANLLADPGVDQRDPAERQALIDNWLQQISLDAGLLGMEKILERLHSVPPHPPGAYGNPPGAVSPRRCPAAGPAGRWRTARPRGASGWCGPGRCLPAGRRCVRCGSRRGARSGPGRSQCRCRRVPRSATAPGRHTARSAPRRTTAPRWACRRRRAPGS